MGASFDGFLMSNGAGRAFLLLNVEFFLSKVVVLLSGVDGCGLKAFICLEAHPGGVIVFATGDNEEMRGGNEWLSFSGLGTLTICALAGANANGVASAW